MTVDSLNYPKMVRDALRSVARAALKQVEEHGLPGVHHFFITFDTQYRGVKLSGDLLARYPEYIKIVLQNDFRDLVVEDDRFSVTLHFGGVPHRIAVPFRAILVFEDPTEEFMLHFEPDSEADGGNDEDEEVLDSEAPAGSLQLPVRAVLAAADRMQAEKEAQTDTEEPVDAEASAEGASNEDSTGPVKPATAPVAGEPALAVPVADRSADGPAPAALEEARKTDGKSAAERKAGKEGAAKDKAAEKSKDRKEITKDNVVSIDAFRRK